jgi:hypothetical protein
MTLRTSWTNLNPTTVRPALDCGVVLPYAERYNGTTSATKFPPNACHVIAGAQTIFAQVIWNGPSEETYNVVFHHGNDADIGGGITLSVLEGYDQWTFHGASNGGLESQPSKSSSTYTLRQKVLASCFVTWNYTINGSGITLYTAIGSGKLQSLGSGGAGDGSGSPLAAAATDIPIIGALPNGSKTFNGSIIRVARWNRILTFGEAEQVLAQGAQAAPFGLRWDYFKGRDWGPFQAIPNFSSNVTIGSTVAGSAPIPVRNTPRLFYPSTQYPPVVPVEQQPALIVPRRFNKSTSIINYGVRPSQDLLEQSVFVQVRTLSYGENLLGGYIFTTVDGSRRNGIIVRVRDSNVMQFMADSSGVVNAPFRQTATTVSYGAVQNFAATWTNGLASSTISIYFSENGEPLVLDSGTGSAGTGSIQVTGGTTCIGSDVSSVRTFDGDIFRVARWNRILSLAELHMVQFLGPESVPLGLVFNWYDGKDHGPYALQHTAQQDIAFGPTSGFVTRAPRRSNILYFPTQQVPVAVTLQYLYPIADIATNGWLPSEGSDLYPMVGEAVKSYTTYIYSPSNPTTQQFEFLVTPGNKPPAGSSLSATLSLRAMDVDTAFDIDLVENTTIKDSWTESVTVAEGDVDRTHVVSSTIIDGMTDFENVRIRGVARAP